jgi:hypothetical protein
MWSTLDKSYIKILNYIVAKSVVRETFVRYYHICTHFFQHISINMTKFNTECTFHLCKPFNNKNIYPKIEKSHKRDITLKNN